MWSAQPQPAQHRAYRQGPGQRSRGVGARVGSVEARHISHAFTDVLGVHRTSMGGVERGERILALQSLERIAATLHIDPTELLQRRGEQSEVKTPRHPSR